MRPSIWGQSLPRGSCDSRERSGQLLNALIPILHQVGFTARFRRRSTGELLPRLSILTRKRAVSFCCTFPGVASAGCYPALCPVVLGLSSPALAGAVAFLTQIHIHFSKTISCKLFLLKSRYISAQSFGLYKILPQFSHSTMPSVVAIFLSITIGSDILHPPHLLLTIFAIGTAWWSFTC